MFRHLFEAGRIIGTRREILARTTLTEIRRRYAGSAFGALWLLIGPLALMVIYAVFYVFVFRLRPPEFTAGAYVLYIFCGLLPYLGFSEALSAGTISLASQRDVLLNTVFPAELVPLRAVLVALAAPTIGLVVVLLADGVVGQFSGWNLLVPVVLLLLAMFVTGLVWLLSLANLVLRDIQQLLNYVSMILLIASPIAYTPAMLPRVFAVVIWLNPLSYFVLAIQDLVLFDVFPPLPVVVGCLVLGIGGFAFGWRTFGRAKRVFFDYA